MLNLDSQFLKSIRDPLIIMDPNHKILFINDSGAAVYNETKENAINKICYKVFKKNEQHCNNCPVEKVLKNGRSFVGEQSEIMPNGQRRYGEVRAYPVFDDNSEIMAVSTIAIDITEKKKKQKNYATYLSEKISKKTDTENLFKDTDDIYLSLSAREIEVLRLIAEGFSNPDISFTLSISLNTVKTHVTNIFNKLGTSDRTLAAIKASKLKII